MDKTAKLTINFHRRRLTEDQNLFTREGDFILYANRFWEITNLFEPRLLFGQQEHKFEIRAECIRARDGLFQEPEALSIVRNLIIDSDDPPEVSIPAAAASNGIDILDGGSADFIEMFTNPSAFAGRIIYLTTLGTPQVAPF
ncbi:MAG: hypothetical protein AABY22_32475, partial [Nanoarchaeota archaeon]